MRAALGAGRGALRRTLLAESLVLCGAGALLGVLLARPLVSVVGRFAARFSVRALDVTVDPSLLWVGAGLAMAAAVVLAYVPRLPSAARADPLRAGRPLACGSRRARAAACGSSPSPRSRSRSCCWSARACCSRRSSRCRRRTPATTCARCWRSTSRCRSSRSGPKAIDFYQEATRRIETLPGVERVAVGNFVPWRDAAAASGPASASPSRATRRGGRGGPARAAADRHARLLRGARRPAHRPAATSPTTTGPAASSS